MKKILKHVFMIFLFVIVALVVTIFIFLQQPQFGKASSGERLVRMQKSPHFKDGAFQNLSVTPDLTEGATMFSAMREFLFNQSKRSKPASVLPSVKTNLKELPSDKNVLVWFGHSSYFMQVDGKKFLVDPVLSGSASPIKFTTRSYAGSDVYTVDDLPSIDYLLLSHDHWDHVDYETLLKLRSKVKKVITGLGTGAHLEYWGYDKDVIVEKDWYEEENLDLGFRITVTPARHFSGRAFQRNRSLWVSFVLATPSMKIYIGGDSGYDTHFKNIGNLYGSFDLVILECGQYNKSWKHIHMMPEEVVLAAEDLKAKMLMPVHWSKFSLGLHAWDDPIIRVASESKKRSMPIVHPLIGEPVILKDTVQHNSWWEKIQ
jgi:L-ascorbate metabolism protein UlaG (beta-lactamase superfamily)